MPGVCCTHFEGGDCQAIQGHCADGCAWEEAAWERLAAYEDTGLTPEEVKKIYGILAEVSDRYNLRFDFVVKCLTEKASEASNNPLTLDELREMVGEPYWHVGLQKDSPPPHYTILPHHIAEHLEDYHYGEYWLAYRRKWSSQ